MLCQMLKYRFNIKYLCAELISLLIPVIISSNISIIFFFTIFSYKFEIFFILTFGKHPWIGSIKIQLMSFLFLSKIFFDNGILLYGIKIKFFSDHY